MNLLKIVIALFLSASIAFAVAEPQVDRRGYIAISELDNLNKLLFETEPPLGKRLHAPEIINETSAKKFAFESYAKSVEASLFIFNAIKTEKMNEQFEKIKIISDEINVAWAGIEDNKFLLKYHACYQAARDFENIWKSCSMGNANRAYPTISAQIELFNKNLIQCKTEVKLK